MHSLLKIIAGPRATWCAVAHGGPVHTLERNPFFYDLLLSVGGWNFCLWREEFLVRKKKKKIINIGGHKSVNPLITKLTFSLTR